jgi:hypothetical protein
VIFTVVWLKSAEEELARLWLDAENRAAITSAGNAVETAMRQNPLAVGESREENQRIIIEPPLVIHCEVNLDDRVVRVGGIALVRRKR